MATSISRKQFLRGDFAGRRVPRRPPWALPEARFLDACDGCGDCVSACPEAILVSGRGRYPEVDFSRGGCLFCGDCVRACRRGALRGDGGQPAWPLKAFVGEACVANRGVECRSCGDQCERLAIRFRLRVGAAAQPILDQAQCNGCGACYAACPASAIEMHRG